MKDGIHKEVNDLIEKNINYYYKREIRNKLAYNKYNKIYEINKEIGKQYDFIIFIGIGFFFYIINFIIIFFWLM